MPSLHLASILCVAIISAVAPAPAAEAPEAPAPPEDADVDAPPAVEETGEAPEAGEEAPPPTDEAPSPETAPKPAAKKHGASAPLVDPAEVARLREEARGIRDDLFKARARVSTITSKLFRSKVTVELKSNIERFYSVEEFTITIDGAPVYFKQEGLAPTKGSIVEMYAAPGSHQMGVSAKLTAKRDQTYQVDIQQIFTVVVPEDSKLRTKLKVHELGNMFTRFSKKKRGTYRLHVELNANAKLNKGAKKKAAVTATGRASTGK